MFLVKNKDTGEIFPISNLVKVMEFTKLTESKVYEPFSRKKLKKIEVGNFEIEKRKMNDYEN